MFKLLKFLKKYWWAALLAPLFMIGEVAMDFMITQQMQKLIDDGIQSSNLQAVKTIGLTMLFYLAIGVACGILSGVFANIASCSYANDLRKSLFDKIMKAESVLEYKDIIKQAPFSAYEKLSLLENLLV